MSRLHGRPAILYALMSAHVVACAFGRALGLGWSTRISFGMPRGQSNQPPLDVMRERAITLAFYIILHNVVFALTSYVNMRLFGSRAFERFSRTSLFRGRGSLAIYNIERRASTIIYDLSSLVSFIHPRGTRIVCRFYNHGGFPPFIFCPLRN